MKIGQLYTGDVEDINLRHTIIRDFENRRVIIPNSVISNETIINSTFTDEKTCMFIEVAISLQTNIDQAIQIIQQEAVKHKYYIDNRNELELARGEHTVMVRVMAFLDSGSTGRARSWQSSRACSAALSVSSFPSLLHHRSSGRRAPGAHARRARWRT